MSVSAITLPEAWRRKHLSPAEQRVVELTATGLSTKEVAARLNKSTLTARNQLNRAMRKIGVRSRYQLIAQVRPLFAQVPAEIVDSPAYAIWPVRRQET